ncbi:MAG: T9SS type A sorting domain-containing protein [candidate division WOR-3 bacterium]|nr:T9SS type A sorting domain-containing protein [candidate division WOR-3 bacterium]
MRNPIGWLVILTSVGLGQNWEMRPIVPEIGYTFDADIVTDSLCLPHVALNRSGYGLAYVSWTGDSWSFECPVGASGWDLDLCLDRNDNPHIGYVSSEWEPEEVRYAFRDGDSWHIETAAEGRVRGWLRFGALALARDRAPHMVFVDSVTIKYAYKSAGTWNVLTVPAYQADPLKHLIGVSIALDTSYRPGIAVDWYKSGYEDSLWLSFFEYDGESWHRSDVDSASGPAPFDFWVPQVRSDPATDLFHIVYRARAYATGKDGNWQVEEAPVPSGGQYACDFVLYRGRPHIVSSGGLFPVQCTWRSAAGWETEWVGPSGTQDGSPSIAVDRKGRPHLTFVSCDDGYLYYARRLFVGTEEPAPPVVQPKLQLQVHPNPAPRAFMLEFSVLSRTTAAITFCDALGRTVWSREEEVQPGPYHSRVSLPASISPGVYFLQVESDSQKSIEKVVLQ